MPKLTDQTYLIGKTFGKLTVVTYHRERINGRLKIFCDCICDCGNTKTVAKTALVGGDQVSCGCERTSRIREVATTHGLSNTRLYSIHKDMNRRCYNRNNKSYEDYGGRGIKVCRQWRGKPGFLNFYNWALSHGYDESLTLDRIDNGMDYEPDNCRWSNVEEQANNKRNNVNITINGETKTKTQWARDYGINYHTVCSRINKGMDPVAAVITPVVSASSVKRRK